MLVNYFLIDRAWHEVIVIIYNYVKTKYREYTDSNRYALEIIASRCKTRGNANKKGHLARDTSFLIVKNFHVDNYLFCDHIIYGSYHLLNDLTFLLSR